MSNYLFKEQSNVLDAFENCKDLNFISSIKQQAVRCASLVVARCLMIVPHADMSFVQHLRVESSSSFEYFVLFLNILDRVPEALCSYDQRFPDVVRLRIVPLQYVVVEALVTSVSGTCGTILSSEIEQASQFEAHCNLLSACLACVSTWLSTTLSPQGSSDVAASAAAAHNDCWIARSEAFFLSPRSIVAATYSDAIFASRINPLETLLVIMRTCFVVLKERQRSLQNADQLQERAWCSTAVTTNTLLLRLLEMISHVVAAFHSDELIADVTGGFIGRTAILAVFEAVIEVVDTFGRISLHQWHHSISVQPSQSDFQFSYHWNAVSVQVLCQLVDLTSILILNHQVKIKSQ